MHQFTRQFARIAAVRGTGLLLGTLTGAPAPAAAAELGTGCAPADAADSAVLSQILSFDPVGFAAAAPRPAHGVAAPAGRRYQRRQQTGRFRQRRHQTALVDPLEQRCRP